MGNHSTPQNPHLKTASDHDTNTTVADAEEEQGQQLTEKQANSQALPEQCSCLGLSAVL